MGSLSSAPRRRNRREGEIDFRFSIFEGIGEVWLGISKDEGGVERNFGGAVGGRGNFDGWVARGGMEKCFSEKS